MGMETGRGWRARSAVFVASAFAVVTLSACADHAPKAQEAATDSHSQTIATPAPVSPATQAAPAPAPVVIVDAFHPELLPKDLQNRIGIRDYKFSRNDDTGQATVSTSIINLSGKDPISFDMAARFTDGDDWLVAQTDWTRVTLKPLAKHQLFAETMDRRAVTGAPLIRLITEKKTE
ncbi:hypothetical protein BH09SUM1_BH09SUM1_24450 [soil metagenome]